MIGQRLVIIVFVSLGCVPSEKKNDRDSQISESKMVVEGITNLPFGCALLISHEFPARWETGDLYKAEDIRPHEKEFDNLIDCFNQLNTKKAFSSPQIKKVEFIQLGNTDHFRNKNSVIEKLDSCRYRLPNIGQLACYYFFENSISLKDPKGKIIEVGNLAILDTLTSQAKILNVYLTSASESTEFRRFFIVDKDQSLRIFESYIEEEHTTLKNTCVIRFIDHEIKIEDIK